MPYSHNALLTLFTLRSQTCRQHILHLPLINHGHTSPTSIPPLCPSRSQNHHPCHCRCHCHAPPFPPWSKTSSPERCKPQQLRLPAPTALSPRRRPRLLAPWSEISSPQHFRRRRLGLTAPAALLVVRHPRSQLLQRPAPGSAL